MAPTRHGLFPVYVDPPTEGSACTSLTSACSKLSLKSSPSRSKRAAAALAGARKPTNARLLTDKLDGSKENTKPYTAVPAPLTNGKKPLMGLGVGRKVHREALRDVSQEFECRGVEPEGFREITPAPVTVAAAGSPPSKPLAIFVDPAPAAASAKSVASSNRPKTLMIYTSPPRKVAVVAPSSITGTVKRGRGLGGGAGLGLGLGGSVGRGLRA